MAKVQTTWCHNIIGITRVSNRLVLAADGNFRLTLTSPQGLTKMANRFADRGLSCRLHVEAPRGEKWERLKAGESNGNLPLRNCLECSVPEPYRSPDWALVPAKKPAFGLNTNDDDDDLFGRILSIFLLLYVQTPR